MKQVSDRDLASASNLDELEARVGKLEAIIQGLMPVITDTRSKVADVQRYLVLTNDRLAELKSLVDALQRPES